MINKEYILHAQRLQAHLSRLTVMRKLLAQPPAVKLMELLDALSGAQAMLATNLYFELVTALIEVGCRRVTGSLWKDFILAALLDEHNAFALQAAAGKRDLPVLNAMAHDLALLEVLYRLDAETLQLWLESCFEERRQHKPRHEKDSIAIMADAAWAGGSLRPVTLREPSKAAPPLPESLYPETFPDWYYPAAEVDGSYISDTALEEVYRRLNDGADWAGFTEELHTFHQAYGSGLFLRYKYFTLDEAGLRGIELEGAEAPQCHEALRRALTENTIRFMRGDEADNTLLIGERGMGKCLQVMALAHELPALRLVLVDKISSNSYLRALEIFSAQPLRFVLLQTNLLPGEQEFERMKAMLGSVRVQPENVLIVATSRSEAARDFFFPLELKFEPLTLKEFVDMAADFLRGAGVAMAYETIQNACIDWKMDGVEMSINAARRLARKLGSKNLFS